MSFLQAIVLGLLQGVAEFLPVSSSGHLLISRQWMGLGDIPRLFDVLLHIASLIVIIFIYRKKVLQLIQSLLPFLFSSAKEEHQDRENRRLFILLLLSTLMTVAVVLVLEQVKFTDQVRTAGICFLFTGALLLSLRFIPEKDSPKKPGWLQSVIIGLVQGIGTLPGISRSGITISTARLLGMEREKAGEYSFLLSIPAILGALVLDLKDGGMLLEQISVIKLAVAFLVTLITGYFSLTLLLSLIRKGRFYLFSFYLIPLGLALLIFI